MGAIARPGTWVIFALCAGLATQTAAQSPAQNLQIHGFATQSFVFSTNNNYLGMDTTSGSPSWTEAAVNVGDQVTDKLRAGVQFHFTRLGAFGSYVPTVDWALVDYAARPWLGVRAGKVKIRWGLYNDTQDADVGYLWALLPESVYGIDVRATNLSQYGGEVYGHVRAGKHLGSLEYSAYYGDYFFASNDGYTATFQQQGLNFIHPAFGKTPGLDLRYATPGKSLQVGGSLMFYDAAGTLTNGSFSQPTAFWPTVYARYHRKRVSASAQYVKLVQYQTVTLDGADPVTTGFDTRSWFVTGSYRVSSKLQLGSYYAHYLIASGGNSSDPANYFSDAVLSSRFDINAHTYAKLEGHLTRGNAVGFYSFNNPEGLQPTSNVLVAKIGFSF